LCHDTLMVRFTGPKFIAFDNGGLGEFKLKFKQMCVQDNYEIYAKLTKNHNHQSTNKCNH
jgi:hypothetical protein